MDKSAWEKFIFVLYGNVGRKLKILAQVCGIIGIVCFLLAFLIELLTMFDAFNGLLLLTMGLLGILCIISSWPLYAFGQLVEDVQLIRSGASKQKDAGADELPDL